MVGLLGLSGEHLFPFLVLELGRIWKRGRGEVRYFKLEGRRRAHLENLACSGLSFYMGWLAPPNLFSSIVHKSLIRLPLIRRGRGIENRKEKGKKEEEEEETRKKENNLYMSMFEHKKGETRHTHASC